LEGGGVRTGIFFFYKDANQTEIFTGMKSTINPTFNMRNDNFDNQFSTTFVTSLFHTLIILLFSLFLFLSLLLLSNKNIEKRLSLKVIENWMSKYHFSFNISVSYWTWTSSSLELQSSALTKSTQQWISTFSQRLLLFNAIQRL